MFEVDKEQGLVLTEVFDGVSVDEVRAATGCPIQVITSRHYDGVCVVMSLLF